MHSNVLYLTSSANECTVYSLLLFIVVLLKVCLYLQMRVKCIYLQSTMINQSACLCCYSRLFQCILKGHSGAELHIYFLVHLESIYYQIFFYSKIVPNCAVAK